MMNPLFRLAACAAAALTLPAIGASATAATAPKAAQGAKASMATKSFVHPELQKARAHAAQLRAQTKADRKRQGAQAGPDDVTPPVLSAFSVDAKTNQRRRGDQAIARWTLSDDLSGGYHLYFQVTGPSGQALGYQETISYSDTTWSSELPIAPGPQAETGNWIIDYAYAYDMRGNWVEYDAAALAALGNTVLRVHNRTYDTQLPTLVSAEILTPTVTLSKNPPGMPYSFGDDFKLRATVADTAGGSIVSGPNYVYFYFCRWEGDSCNYALQVQEAPAVWGEAQKTYTLGTRLTPGWPTGTYELYQMYVADNAGNVQYYTDINRGGETDFSTFMPGGTSFEVLP